MDTIRRYQDGVFSISAAARKRILAQARAATRAVDKRAQSCPHALCCRQRKCMADPLTATTWNSRTGGCPITARDEWVTIQFGLWLVLGDAFETTDAVRAETGETAAQVQRRLFPAWPKRWDRRSLMELKWNGTDAAVRERGLRKLRAAR